MAVAFHRAARRWRTGLPGFIVLAVTFLYLQSGPPVAAEPIVAVDAKLEEVGSLNRLSFDLTQPAEARAFVLADPMRIVIDLPEVNFQVEPVHAESVASVVPAKPALPGRSRGRAAAKNELKPPVAKPLATLIKSYRFGLLGPGRSRIVIDLTGPARIVRASTDAIGAGGASRLTIEVEPTDATAFRTAAEAAARADDGVRAPVTAAAPAGRADANKPLIVIDPGHGGIDTGAASAGGQIEKILVMDFARMLAARLEAGGRYRVILTRSDDRFITLPDRVQVARDNRAALFISIHADTLSNAQEVQGATIYTLAETATDAESKRVADKENQADALAGVATRQETGDVNDILFDLTRRETRTYSHLFARTLVSLWQGSGRLNKNPQRAAGFRVLRAPDVPSVLVELGYLSNHRDTAEMLSAAWRETTADTLSRSIDRFFSDRIIETPGPAVPAAPAKAPDWLGVASGFGRQTVR